MCAGVDAAGALLLVLCCALRQLRLLAPSTLFIVVIFLASIAADASLKHDGLHLGNGRFPSKWSTRGTRPPAV
jgi:hypothetical protein